MFLPFQYPVYLRLKHNEFFFIKKSLAITFNSLERKLSLHYDHNPTWLLWCISVGILFAWGESLFFCCFFFLKWSLFLLPLCVSCYSVIHMHVPIWGFFANQYPAVTWKILLSVFQLFCYILSTLPMYIPNNINIIVSYAPLKEQFNLLIFYIY